MKEHVEQTKKIRHEGQRQKRLIAKARRLTNEEILEILRQGHENKEAAKAKGKAQTKTRAVASK